uniref:DDE Tnp4 domain-containing protein n=1 Tax=Chenopodium quinoa TaxID=63459 RepID=A0A803MGH7_CHEQI
MPLHVGGEPGSEWIHRLLTGHPNLCKEQLRVDKDIFIKLVDVLRWKELLSDGRFIYVEEQVGIRLFMMAKADSYRDVAERFQHSISTISIYFRAVLKALVSLSCDIIRPYQSFNESPPEIKNNSLYWPFFKNCVGALDGTHIEAVVDDVGGSAHDTRVWTHCLGDVTKKFPHPPSGKYFLVDSAYPNTLGYLSPHMGKDLRYHFPDFEERGPPIGNLEHYNYRHSSLRSTIERCFGVLKKKWKILKMMPPMDEAFQLSIIVATFTLHNFIRLYELGIPILRG